jgi:hypothetical protein
MCSSCVPFNDPPDGEKYINGDRPSHSASCFQIRSLLVIWIGDPATRASRVGLLLVHCGYQADEDPAVLDVPTKP